MGAKLDPFTGHWRYDQNIQIDFFFNCYQQHRMDALSALQLTFSIDWLHLQCQYTFENRLNSTVGAFLVLQCQVKLQLNPALNEKLSHLESCQDTKLFLPSNQGIFRERSCLFMLIRFLAASSSMSSLSLLLFLSLLSPLLLINVSSKVYHSHKK